MKAMFGDIVADFDGDLVTETLYTVEPEANIVSALTEVRDRFGVRVGCYPDHEAGHNRLTLSGTDADAIADAAAWLLDAIEASETPVSRDWDSEDGGND
jgi:nicotinamide-nucleotide amidase